ncbi:penicillin acylase family protein [Phenylobacterium kunshanense]|uniref:Acylase n=1 Tax=Phenylobacterium kunshanense TaxID=1445034 RepID=A0A328BPM9_9CAUL|nr:penicillin acylase family protein [Phenylobacterium kunshanense]RAK68987.1 acylase [Phenylobacterium kunshanense]
MRPAAYGLALFLLALPAAAAEGPADWKAQAARVTITRDDWGIAHVRGKTDADAVFGMAFAQAEDDFNRVEMNYLTALGRVAEAEGEAAIWQDLRQRLWIDPAELKSEYAKSPAWLRALMDAWAAGLNHYLATHPAVKPKVITRFEPWMALSFTEGSIGGDIERVSLKELEAFYGGTRTAEAEMPFVFREPTGSNGIAIAPKLTKDGRALLLINPHTSFFFRSELQVTSEEGLNAYGAVTWGQFFIYQGFNATAGWMHTSSGVDVVDEFAETIVRTSGALRYRYGREARPMETREVTLAFRRDDGTSGQRTFTTYRTHHGPIVRAEGDRWIAMALMHKPAAALSQSFLRTKAKDLPEFARVAETYRANSSNNTLFADAKGAIAYLHPQFIPVRDDRFDYTKPVDGADPATDWKGLHPAGERPEVKSPDSGWAFNTNNWPYSNAGSDSSRREAFPKYMDTFGENPRGVHALNLLSGSGAWTLDGLVTAAYDPALPAFDRLIPALAEAYEATPEGDPLRARLGDQMAALKAWDRRWSKESTETALAVFWGEALWAKAVPAAKAAGRNTYDQMVLHTSAAEKLQALAEATDRLAADFGSWRTPWGEINRYQRLTGDITQAFKDDAPSIAVPFTSGQWGSLASFGARRYPGTKRYYGTSGNSFVAVVEFGPKVRARAVSAGGESGDPASPHFADQAQRYADGDLREVRFHPEEVAAHARRTYRPGE